jgi:hypothetical protein
LESDKQRRQRKLDQLVFEVLAAQYTGPESWMCWNDWFELTKAKCGDLGLGNSTFSECTKRLLDQGKVRRSQIAKNRFYQVIFSSGSSLGVESLSGGVSSRAPDKAAQALALLLHKKSSA